MASPGWRWSSITSGWGMTNVCRMDAFNVSPLDHYRSGQRQPLQQAVPAPARAATTDR
jgi:hypothetical protein